MFLGLRCVTCAKLFGVAGDLGELILLFLSFVERGDTIGFGRFTGFGGRLLLLLRQLLGLLGGILTGRVDGFGDPFDGFVDFLQGRIDILRLLGVGELLSGLLSGLLGSGRLGASGGGVELAEFIGDLLLFLGLFGQLLFVGLLGDLLLLLAKVVDDLLGRFFAS